MNNIRGRGTPTLPALLLSIAAATPVCAQRAPTIVRFRAYSTPLMLDSIAIPYEFEAPTDPVYHAVVQAAEEFKLKIGTRDSIQGAVGHSRWATSGPLGGQPASQSLNCGSSLMGPNADHHRLTLAWVALIDPLARERSRVRFALAGESQNVTGTGGQPSACQSTGVLERRLADRVRAIISGS